MNCTFQISWSLTPLYFQIEFLCTAYVISEIPIINTNDIYIISTNIILNIVKRYILEKAKKKIHVTLSSSESTKLSKQIN